MKPKQIMSDAQVLSARMLLLAVHAEVSEAVVIEAVVQSAVSALGASVFQHLPNTHPAIRAWANAEESATLVEGIRGDIIRRLEAFKAFYTPEGEVNRVN